MWPRKRPAFKARPLAGGAAQDRSFGLVAAISGIVAFPAGLLANGLFHERGHYAGARLAGSITPRNPIVNAFPMFHFDMGQVALQGGGA